MTLNIKPKEATAVINSLTGGVVPKIGVQHITVGRTDEVETFVKALNEVKEGHSMVKFWIGDFGSGKSFMLHLLTTVALKQKFVVTNADFTPHTRLYSNDGKSVGLYTDLMNNLAIQTKPEGGALSVLLEKWIDRAITDTARQHSIPLTNIRNDQYIPFIQETIIGTINKLSETGGFTFGLIITKYYEGFITGNEELKKNALKWLKGEYRTKTEAKSELGVSEIINDQNYYDMLKNFCRLFVSVGYNGFVINLDEAINLYKISNPSMRMKNYEQLLNIYNDCFQGKTESLFFNFAGATEVLEDSKRGFYSYRALKSRLKVNKFETREMRDFAQPVIRLMPLDHNEIFVLLKKLKIIFDFHYQTEVYFQDRDIHTYMEEMYNKPGASEFLTPREVIRDFLNILNILRQNPEADKEKLFQEITITDERNLPSESERQQVWQKKAADTEKHLRNFTHDPSVITRLTEMLQDDEHCLKAVACSYTNKAGTLIVTEKRLIFMDKQANPTSFLYSRINEMSYTKGPQHSTLLFLSDNEKTNIELIPNTQIKPLITLLQAQIDILERKTLAAELKYREKLITDKEIKERLHKMSRIAYIIQEKEPIKGEFFLARHAETLIKVLDQFYILENSGLDSPETVESLERIKNTVELIARAFERELTEIFKSDMLDIDSESEVYLQQLRNKGLIDDQI